jgi:hypothetical protein
MSAYNRDQDIADAFAAMQQRLAALEAAIGVRRFTTVLRPAASALPGAVIFNLTTLKHEGSNGAAWTALY